MNGKIAASVIVGAALIAGPLMYYLQVYGFYRPVPPTNHVTLTTRDGAQVEVPVTDFDGIDSDSSPLRYRACFGIAEPLATLGDTYLVATDPVPLIGPGWFSCYDAVAVGEALEAGEALAFVGTHEVSHGVDRIVAILPDGRAFAWHQLNGTLEDGD